MKSSIKAFCFAAGVGLGDAIAPANETSPNTSSPVALASGRPTKAEWDAQQKDKAAADAAAAADDAKMAAVDKVITLLEGLTQQVKEEGEKESWTYNKFACFCKDTSAEKTDTIERGSDYKTSLTADIESLAEERSGLDEKIEELVEDIKTAEDTIKDAKKTRSENLKEYTKHSNDLTGAIQAVSKAMSAVKAGAKGGSLVQVQESSKSIRDALVMADFMGVGSPKAQKTIAMFLQQKPEVEMEDYKSHSGGIIETLEGLLKEFRGNKAELDAEEVSSVAKHESLVQEQTDILKDQNKQLQDSKDLKASKTEMIASNSKQLTTVAATLLDDQKYFLQLTNMCSDRAKTWDQRTQVRSDELSALTAATTILKTTVKEKTASGTVRLAQQGVTVRMAQAIVTDESAMEAEEADAESFDPPSFLQRAGVKSHFLAPVKTDARQKIMALLRSQGTKLKSTLLTALANKIDNDKNDPFTKIKGLIEELIDRLLKEAADESDQKDFCDKSISDAEKKRDDAAQNVEDLNGKMSELEATRDQLTEELNVLAEEIDELTKQREAEQKMRNEESDENAATVQSAKDGLSAVQEAIEILGKFYGGAEEESVDLKLIQKKKGPADDAPDAGFEGGEAYKGGQSEATGVVGMLEVIESDFDRTITETEKAEEEAAKAFEEFQTSTGKSLKQKEEATEEKKGLRNDTEDELTSKTEDFKTEIAILSTSIKELLELKPTCIDTGMSYEERVARREDEIESLKKALCILSAYSQYGADGDQGVGDSC